MPTYYEQYGKKLKRAIAKYKVARSGMENLFYESEYSIFNELESGITRYQPRYYQVNAMYALDYLLSCPDSQPEKESIIEVIDEDITCPFYGFEMATGSGKTMLMGSFIYLLNKKYGLNNFLIITPASTDIYQKTIRNFEKKGYESIWNEGTPFDYNLITGDNYNSTIFFDPEKEVNIFIFNIPKFGKNATNTIKRWEASVWKDNDGNTIGMKDFLIDKRLVIITDEAHHAQNRASNLIIKSFHPGAVIEFSATAVEKTRNLEKRNQTIVYKYDIRQFLEDGYGKLVRAIALSEVTNNANDGIAISERLKLITMLLIHLMKQRAVSQDPAVSTMKPIAFVKVKDDTIYAEKVFNYIKNDLSDDVENINIITEKIKAQEMETLNLLGDLIEGEFNGDISKLQSALKKSALQTIFYHGKSDKITERQFRNIRDNDVEIVVYMQKLDEGIDLANIYTMAVINDTITDFTTSIKQIIGRGVRLNKEQREFDDSTDFLLKQSEMLHIVCDQGASFEEVIEQIQKEFGLNDKYFSLESEKNRILNEAKSDLLSKKYLPHIKARQIAKKDVELAKLIQDYDKIFGDFIDQNCFKDEVKSENPFLKYKPETFFVEADVFADKKVFHSQLLNAGATPKQLHVGEAQQKAIYGIVMKHLFCLPDNPVVYKYFGNYIEKINALKLNYYCVDDIDEKLVMNFFVSTFAFFYRNFIEKNYLELDFSGIDQDDSWSLFQNFKEYEFLIPGDQIKNDTINQNISKAEHIDKIKSGYYYYGYKYSIYEYVKFDSYPEKLLADYLDWVIENEGLSEKDFWIRNERQIHFSYGSRKYFPDFILYHNDKTYVIEVKGEKYSDYKKNVLLKKLDEIEGYKSILVFENLMENNKNNPLSFNDFISMADSMLERHQARYELLTEVEEMDQYSKYLPVYSQKKAYKKYIDRDDNTNPDGWIEHNRGSAIPKSCFVIQWNGHAMLPYIKHNDWCIFDSDLSQKDDLDDEVVLLQNDNIDNEGLGKYAGGKFYKTSEEQGGLFKSNNYILEPSNNDYESIPLEGFSNINELNIIGYYLETL